MHLVQRAGLPADCRYPACLKMKPPSPANGAEHNLHRGGDGMCRNTRRWLASPGLSPVSTERTRSGVHPSAAICPTYCRPSHAHRCPGDACLPIPDSGDASPGYLASRNSGVEIMRSSRPARKIKATATSRLSQGSQPNGRHPPCHRTTTLCPRRGILHLAV
jgi:hypothetical protein